MKKEKTRMAIFVSPETHRKFKIKAVKEGRTFDQLLTELLKK